MKRICVLASGGDAPGMNACVEGLYTYAKKRGIEVWAAIGGYDGIVSNNVKMLGDEVLDISSLTGCILKCGRSTHFMTDTGLKQAIGNIKSNKFDAIVILGGNGSLKGAWDRLHLNGVNVIGIPSTIDNDVNFTDHSLGFDSAVEYSTTLVDNLKGTMQTNNRHQIVEVMGRGSPAVAIKVGIATGADIIDTVHSRHTPQQIAELFTKSAKPSLLVIMQEVKAPGNDPQAQSQGSSQFLQQVSTAMGTQHDRVRLTVLGHLQRGAKPSAHDRYLGFAYADYAINAIAHDNYNIAVGILKNTNTIACVHIEQANTPIES